MIDRVSVVIPTYRRGQVLLDTIRYLLELPEPPGEILIVDQTEEHPPEILEVFQGLETDDADFSRDWKKSIEKFQGLEKRIVRRICLDKPSIPHAMNVGLKEAAGEIVLFLDDDIIPNENLVSNHWKTHEDFPEAAAVVGQVLQPGDGWENAENRNTEKLKTEMWERNAEMLKTESLKKRERKAGNGKSDHLKTDVSNFQRFKFSTFISSGFPDSSISGFISSVFQRFKISVFRSFSFSAFQSSPLRRDLDFKFNASSPAWVTNVMAGNLSVKKEAALRVGGFDENFIPPVSFRFETEFTKRLIAAGEKIRFEPSASIRHLRAGQGGTRTRGSHLSSASPIHGVGDYYYALRCGRGFEKILYMLRRPFREVRTQFHLTHPWFVPVKWVGELRAFRLAKRLLKRGPRVVSNSFSKPWKLVAVETHPIQYKAPLFRLLAEDPRFDLTVLYAMIPDSSQQGDGFGVSFEWDVPLLDGYRYELLENRAKEPSVSHFRGCDTPGVYRRLKEMRPDVVLVNGWVVKTCLQTLWACRCLGIPCIVRGEANLLRQRAGWKHRLHDVLLPWYSAYLAIGSASRDFYRFHRCRDEQIFFAPYAIDNDRFAVQARERVGQRASLRQEFGIPTEKTVFLFVGKLEEKKHPLDLLHAVSQLVAEERSQVHVLIAGDGELISDCKKFTTANSLPVTFAGFVNQSRLPDVYAAADVFVLPSDAGETWGLVVNEAMASGLPAIVSTSVGCCQDLIVEGKTGYAFKRGDIDALMSCCQQVISSPERATQQGQAALEHIQNFSFNQIIDGLAEAVECLLKC